MKYIIYHPFGGYGNHLRWLLLLSKEFQFQTLNKPKIDFIETFVYSKNRTCFNWLLFEWRYRKQLDNQFMVSHTIDESILGKSIVLTYEPELAYKAYLKFNPCLNGYDKNGFLEQVRTHNQENLQDIFGQEKLALDAKLVYNPTLDKTFYETICDFLEIEKVYDIANKIHGLWYSLHIKAEDDVCNIPKEFSKFSWYLHTTEFSPTNQQDYDIIFNRIQETYNK